MLKGVFKKLPQNQIVYSSNAFIKNRVCMQKISSIFSANNTNCIFNRDPKAGKISFTTDLIYVLLFSMVYDLNRNTGTSIVNLYEKYASLPILSTVKC